MIQKKFLLIGLGLLSLHSFGAANIAECPTGMNDPLDKNLSEIQTALNKDNDCPEPTREQYDIACMDVSENQGSSVKGFKFEFEVDLWEMSCAKIGVDTPEQGREKVRAMWDKYKTKFGCKGYTNVVMLDGANIFKLSMTKSNLHFIRYAIDTYGLDVNFVDPIDNKTLLDYVEEKLKFYEAQGIEYVIRDHRIIYKFLLDKKAKRAKEL